MFLPRRALRCATSPLLPPVAIRAGKPFRDAHSQARGRWRWAGDHRDAGRQRLSSGDASQADDAEDLMRAPVGSYGSRPGRDWHAISSGRRNRPPPSSARELAQFALAEGLPVGRRAVSNETGHSTFLCGAGGAARSGAKRGRRGSLLVFLLLSTSPPSSSWGMRSSRTRRVVLRRTEVARRRRTRYQRSVASSASRAGIGLSALIHPPAKTVCDPFFTGSHRLDRRHSSSLGPSPNRWQTGRRATRDRMMTARDDMKPAGRTWRRASTSLRDDPQGRSAATTRRCGKQLQSCRNHGEGSSIQASDFGRRCDGSACASPHRDGEDPHVARGQNLH